MRVTHRIAIVIVGLIVAAALPAHAQDWVAAAQIHMSRLESELAQLGPAQAERGGALTFGATTIGSDRA